MVAKHARAETFGNPSPGPDVILRELVGIVTLYLEESRRKTFLGKFKEGHEEVMKPLMLLFCRNLETLIVTPPLEFANSFFTPVLHALVDHPRPYNMHSLMEGGGLLQRLQQVTV